MFSLATEIEMSGRCHRHALFDGVEPVSYATVIELWQSSEGFRNWFAAQLSAAPYPAFRWETPAVTTDSLGQPFEYVVVDAPEINIPADPEPFAAMFSADGNPVLKFPNLGNDAVMVVPAALSPGAAFPHLGAFLRQAPDHQIDTLWRCVGEAVEEGLGKRPVWLNTAGGGVAWLHVRLDSRPKYYVYAPYRRA